MHVITTYIHCCLILLWDFRTEIQPRIKLPDNRATFCFGFVCTKQLFIVPVQSTWANSFCGGTIRTSNVSSTLFRISKIAVFFAFKVRYVLFRKRSWKKKYQNEQYQQLYTIKPEKVVFSCLIWQIPCHFVMVLCKNTKNATGFKQHQIKNSLQQGNNK